MEGWTWTVWFNIDTMIRMFSGSYWLQCDHGVYIKKIRIVFKCSIWEQKSGEGGKKKTTETPLLLNKRQRDRSEGPKLPAISVKFQQMATWGQHQRVSPWTPSSSFSFSPLMSVAVTRAPSFAKACGSSKWGKLASIMAVMWSSLFHLKHHRRQQNRPESGKGQFHHSALNTCHLWAG